MIIIIDKNNDEIRFNQGIKTLTFKITENINQYQEILTELLSMIGEQKEPLYTQMFEEDEDKRFVIGEW